MKKEENVLELFFNEPTKHWHFEKILKEAKISRPQAVNWLRKLLKESLIKRVKPIGMMPYYVGDCESPAYQIRKRLYALNTLENVGFLQHLMGLPNVLTVVIFGSFSRWDWYAESDIDVFFYGDPAGLDTMKYERKLHRDIDSFVSKDTKELQKFRHGFLKNVTEGFLVKGDLGFLEAARA